ncbi:MAG: fatty acid desaturase [Alphaproteobacteria bacterium]|nr:MAG: fatty acid desaturase [Alphaproteobacteria bacterium]
MLREFQEMRTLALVVICYGLWAGLLFGPDALPLWLTALVLVPVIAFHSSLQHECIHGHPFLNGAANDMLAYPPIGIFLPFPRYKENHLIHHQKASISDPLEDPESWYLTRRQWDNCPKWLRLMFSFNNRLLGRLLLGPLIGTVALVLADAGKIRAGDFKVARIWVFHLLAVTALLVLVGLYGRLSVPAYLVLSYFGMSLLMIRTYLEHQAHPEMRGRSVLIEDKGPLSFLFLNNNLHAVHHAYPSLAWYRLPSMYAKHRERFLKMNKGYFYRNYGEIFRKFTFFRKEPVVFPLDPS